MTHRTVEMLAFLDRHRADLGAAVDDVPASRRQQAPGPGRWCVAEVIEHLGLVEARIARLVGARFAELHAAGELAEDVDTGSALSRTDVEQLRDRTRRIETGAASRPTSAIDADEAWARLTRSRATVRDLVTAADGLAVAAVVLPHPVFGTFDFYQWIGFLGGHDARHALQIREIGRALHAGTP